MLAFYHGNKYLYDLWEYHGYTDATHLERAQLQENHAEFSRVMYYPAYEAAMQVVAKLHKALMSSFTYEQIVMKHHRCNESKDAIGMNSLVFRIGANFSALINRNF